MHSANDIQIAIHNPNQHQSNQVKISGSGMKYPKLPLLMIYMQH